jgi:hypothetical protein
MLKKTLFVLLSALILSGVCFAQEDSAKKQMEDTTPAAAQEQPAAVAQEQPAAVAQEQSALVLEEIHICTAVEDRHSLHWFWKRSIFVPLLRIGSPLTLELYSLMIWTNYTVLPKLAGQKMLLMLIMFGILRITKLRELNCL